MNRLLYSIREDYPYNNNAQTVRYMNVLPYFMMADYTWKYADTVEYMNGWLYSVVVDYLFIMHIQ